MVIGLSVGGFLKFERVISMIFPVGKVPVKQLRELVIVTKSVVVPIEAVHVGFVEVDYKFDRQVVS